MIRSLSIWIDPICLDHVTKALSSTTVLPFSGDFSKFYDNPIDPPPNLVVCGVGQDGLSTVEVAQAIRLSYPDTKLVHVTSVKAGFQSELLKKNGFHDAFLLPFEVASFEKYVQQLTKSGAAAAQNFRSVKLVDFQGETPLEFDTFTFLPLNGKFIRMSAAGKALRPEQVKKLKEHDVGNLHIKQDDLKKFYQFTAQRLVEMGKSDSMSETEKQEKMQESVRAIVGGVFSDSAENSGFDAGKKLLGDCQGIVKSYIVATGKQASLYERLTEMSRDSGDVYSRATNVSTFAALFSIGLSIGNPEEIAMASLLRDIGQADLPPEIQNKTKEERTPAEEKIYQKHPELSIQMIKARRMVISDKVVAMIMQHHENHDGTGFPHGVNHEKILPESQLLAIADELDEKLVVVSGKPRLTPRQAIESILKDESEASSKRRFDPNLLKRLSALLIEEK